HGDLGAVGDVLRRRHRRRDPIAGGGGFGGRLRGGRSGFGCVGGAVGAACGEECGEGEGGNGGGPAGNLNGSGLLRGVIVGPRDVGGAHVSIGTQASLR